MKVDMRSCRPRNCFEPNTNNLTRAGMLDGGTGKRCAAFVVCAAFCATWVLNSQAISQDQTDQPPSQLGTKLVLSSEPQVFEAASAERVKATRTKKQVQLEVPADLSQVQIPRLTAPLRSLEWRGAADFAVMIRPEPDHWILSWKKRPPNSNTLLLNFGDEPRLLSESASVATQPDGSILLPAHKAVTIGEKVRYEPQSFKNTVGYWVGAKDRATWTFTAPTAGSYNVAILQGCGKGQGGSDAVITVSNTAQDKPLARLPFKVEETGHFQNFQWRTLGEIEVPAGTHQLTIQPTKIANKALMDVRNVHLIRLPASAAK